VSLVLMRDAKRSARIRPTRPSTWQNDVRDATSEPSVASSSTKLSLPTVPTSTVSPFFKGATTERTASIGKSMCKIRSPTDCVDCFARSVTTAKSPTRSDASPGGSASSRRLPSEYDADFTAPR
jgi:hypothetical protein